jgi:hypothetical protein
MGYRYLRLIGDAPMPEGGGCAPGAARLHSTVYRAALGQREQFGLSSASYAHPRLPDLDASGIEVRGGT